MVMDGHVNKEERLSLWNSTHRRIIFATPQAFKNDVFKGRKLHLCPAPLPAALPCMQQPLTATSVHEREPRKDQEHFCAFAGGGRTLHIEKLLWN